jgi:CheY-like chemotaxis protein
LFKLHVPARPTTPIDLPDHEKSVRPLVIGLEPNQPRLRLLVTDDREESRQLLVKLLVSWGFDVRAAVNGLEAFNIWKGWQPHLIWMDMRMPVMDGHEATRRIKAASLGQQQTIIIALTASAFEEEREQVMAEGCDDFVRKPFRQEEIAHKLTQHLGVRFIYEGQVDDQAGAFHPQAPLDLTGLPADWRADLRQAAVEADADKILQLAEHIRAQHPALASMLAGAVNNFDYESILNSPNQLNI